MLNRFLLGEREFIYIYHSPCMSVPDSTTKVGDVVLVFHNNKLVIHGLCIVLVLWGLAYATIGMFNLPLGLCLSIPVCVQFENIFNNVQAGWYILCNNSEYLNYV